MVDRYEIFWYPKSRHMFLLGSFENMKKFLVLPSVLSLIVGCGVSSYANAGDVTDMIIEAKKKVGELEVKQTQITLQLAQEGQALKQIENNAMLDTQNYITSEKDKIAQLKDAISKIEELGKKQDDLAKEVQELRAKVAETKEKQKQAQEKELQKEKTKPIVTEKVDEKKSEDEVKPNRKDKSSHEQVAQENVDQEKIEKEKVEKKTK